MRALTELALAAGRSPLSAALIARQQALSVAYLEPLLLRLKRRGLITSVRGPKGGYLLAREPAQITMAEVVRILDGETTLRNGKAKDGSPSSPWGHPSVSAGAKGPSSRQAGRHAQRIASAVFRCVHERLAKSLDQITLQDLCDEVRTSSGESLGHRYVFHI
jgi:Rrf2 family protein